MFVTYRHTNIQTYIQTLWLPESLDLLDRETKKHTQRESEKASSPHVHALTNSHLNPDAIKYRN